MLSTPAGLELWKKNRGLYDPPFVQRVDRLEAQMQERPRSETDVLAGK